MRVLLEQEPFFTPNSGWYNGGNWPAFWIRHPEALGTEPFVAAFRLNVTIPDDKTYRLHVSADERYELYIDGKRFGRGPERGDVAHWFYESYDATLSAGFHVIVVHTWWIGPLAAFAQMSHAPGFVLAAEGEEPELFNTGHAPWSVTRLEGYEFAHPGQAWGTGANIRFTGAEHTWGFEIGGSDGWETPVKIQQARNRSQNYEIVPGWRLVPAVLPAMLEERRNVGTVRHVDELKPVEADVPGIDPAGAMMPPLEAERYTGSNRAAHVVEKIDTTDILVTPELRRLDEVAAWQAVVSGTGAIEIPPSTVRRVIVDLGDYYCAYPELALSGGKGAAVRIDWAEALYVQGKHEKGNRNEIDGKRFFAGGVGDTFLHDGERDRTYTTLWWQAGRYVQLIVATGAESVTVDGFALRETHYPYEFTSEFTASDSRIDAVTPIAKRVMEMCSHETYMDCPYYEQMMYVGDTRLEVLTTYALTNDDRLPRKALTLFDWSRESDGLTTSRYPCHTRQIIPPFSLWWVAMVHDFALWRDDPSFVGRLMPGVRAVIEAYRSFLNADGLLSAPTGWNFMDWVPNWSSGEPPDGAHGVSGVLNWHFVLVLGQAAALERQVGEPLLAERHEQLAAKIAERATVAFYDEMRGLLADDLAHTKWSEHSQCLALLSRRLPRDLRGRIAEGLTSDPAIERTTIYFTHYLFETYRQLKRADLLFERLGLWYGLAENGFKTTFEMPEPSRSDCHAWGAHPYFHYFATILGIRPLEPGFKEVEIDPQLGPLTFAKGVYPHPAGPIQIEVRREGEALRGTVTLPEGVVGVLHLGKSIRVLQAGTQKF